MPVVYYQNSDSKIQKYGTNNQVAFVCSDEQASVAVQIEGIVERITERDVHDVAMNAMYRFSAAGKTNFPPIEKLFAGDYVTMKIVPAMIKMGIFMHPDAESNEEL